MRTECLTCGKWYEEADFYEWLKHQECGENEEETNPKLIKLTTQKEN